VQIFWYSFILVNRITTKKQLKNDDLFSICTVVKYVHFLICMFIFLFSFGNIKYYDIRLESLNYYC
jgi:hypothetical protein